MRPTVRRLVAGAGILAVAGGVAGLVIALSGGSGNRHTGLVQGTVWVANEGSASLSAIDASTHEVVATLKGIEGPHNVQVAPDGRSVWAVSGHDGYAAMVDGSSLALHGVVPTGKEPAHVVVMPDGRTVWVTNAADDTVTSIDAPTMKPSATLRVGGFPHGLRPSPDGRLLAVANAKDGTVSFLDAVGRRKLADVEVGDTPVQVAFAPDGRLLYVSLKGENAVAKIDVASRRLIAKTPVGRGPIQVYVTPNGKDLLVANQGSEQKPGRTLSVVDTRTFRVGWTVETGDGAHGVVVEPTSRHAYVTNLYGGDVAVVDLLDRKVVARIAVGSNPNGVSFARSTSPPRGELTLPIPEDSAMEEMGHSG